MKANHDKCHLLFSDKNLVTMNLSGIEIKNTQYEKLIGIKVDCELKYKNYLYGVITKASIQVNVLSRITPLMSSAKKKNEY